MAQTPKGEVLRRLRKVLNEIAELKELQYDRPQFRQWARGARVVINDAFDGKSEYLEAFDHARAFMEADLSTDHRPLLSRSQYQEIYLRNLGSIERDVLEPMIDAIDKYWGNEVEPLGSSHSHRSEQITTKEVFTVHGRDEAAREKVARFLEKLELKPVVLHEQPNKGRTVIEKFEDYSHVGFAVVLLTPDDEGRLRNGKGDFKPRARQNVILELGYFLGKLDRERVCALVKEGVEWPSDYDGVVYIPLDDSGGWELRLIRELKSAGYDIDANQAFAT